MQAKYEFPKFYIKNVGGKLTITHRLTHTYLEAVDNVRELKVRIKYYNSLTEEDLWVLLIDTHKISIPSSKDSVKLKGYKKDSQEDWFYSAWYSYTDKFYTKFPQLFVEVLDIPYQFIQTIIRKRYEDERTLTLQREEERRKAEEAYDLEVKQTVRKEKKDKSVIEDKGKLGSQGSLDRLKKKKLKGIKKLKIKGKVDINILDSDDPFA